MKKVITFIITVVAFASFVGCSSPSTSDTVSKIDTNNSIKDEIESLISSELKTDYYSATEGLFVYTNSDNILDVSVHTYRGCTMPIWNYELCPILDEIINKYDYSGWKLTINVRTYKVLVWDRKSGENGRLTYTEKNVLVQKMSDKALYDYWEDDLKTWAENNNYDLYSVKF